MVYIEGHCYKSVMVKGR